MENFDYDYEPSSDNHSYQGYQNKRSNTFGIAALVLSIISVLTPYFVYTTLICAPLSILFALLSKGGEMKTDGRAKVSIILSVIGLILLVSIVAFAFSFVASEYGSIENYLEYYGYPTDTMYTYPDTL